MFRYKWHIIYKPSLVKQTSYWILSSRLTYSSATVRPGFCLVRNYKREPSNIPTTTTTKSHGVISQESFHLSQSRTFPLQRSAQWDRPVSHVDVQWERENNLRRISLSKLISPYSSFFFTYESSSSATLLYYIPCIGLFLVPIDREIRELMPGQCSCVSDNILLESRIYVQVHYKLRERDSVEHTLFRI